MVGMKPDSGELFVHGGYAFLAPELAPDEPFRPVFPSSTWSLGGTKKLRKNNTKKH